MLQKCGIFNVTLPLIDGYVNVKYNLITDEDYE